MFGRDIEVRVVPRVVAMFIRCTNTSVERTSTVERFRPAGRDQDLTRIAKKALRRYALRCRQQRAETIHKPDRLPGIVGKRLNRFGPVHSTPVRESVRKNPLPDKSERLLIDLLDDFQREAFGTVDVPCRLQAYISAAALSQGEPKPVLDCAEVRRPADPALTQWPTED